MKFIHLADLHFGKLLFDVNLVTEGDQREWCRQCLDIVRKEKPDAVLIAGDIYDRSQPSAEARRLVSTFLTELTHLSRVFMIAGNHDSGENVEYLSDLLAEQGLFAAGIVERELKHITLEDEHGPVTVWLAPYFFPTRVQEALGCDGIRGYTEAAEMLLAAQKIDSSGRNVLVAHQLVLFGSDEPEHGKSETSVGGLGQIDMKVFDAFDYVALGHIHKQQKIGREGLRYAGAPLCYHFEEAGKQDEGNDRLGILVVELGKKGETPRIRRVPTHPLHRLRSVTGTLTEILETERKNTRSDEYIHVTLTDPILPEHAQKRLEVLFAEKGSRLVALDRALSGAHTDLEERQDVPQEKPLQDLFLDYYTYQYGEDRVTELDQTLLIRAAALLEEEGTTDLEASAEKLVRFALEQEGEV